MRKLDHDQEREKIAEVAANLIAQKGAMNVTANDIAQAMGATRGKVLHYFHNAQSVIDAAFEWASQRGVDRLNNLVNELEVIEFDERIVSELLPLDYQTDVEWKVRFACWERSLATEEGVKFQKHIADTRLASLVELVTQFKENGLLKKEYDPEIVAMQLYDMMVGLGIRLLYYPIEERMKRSQGMFDYIAQVTDFPGKDSQA